MMKNLGLVVILFGVALVISPVMFATLQIGQNFTSLHNCDTLTGWEDAYAGLGGTMVIDTVDKVEGIGAVSISYSGVRETTMTLYLPYVDLSLTPILRFSMKLSSLTPTMPWLEVISFDYAGVMSVLQYTFSFSSTNWETKEIDLRAPTSGSGSVTGVRYVTWHWNDPQIGSLDGQTWKVDDVEAGEPSGYVPPPPQMYSLTVNSVPTDISYTINGQAYTTGSAVSLASGSYAIIMPSSTTIATQIYTFQQWENGVTNPQRTVQLSSTTTLTATYQIQQLPPPVNATNGYLEIHAFLNVTEVNAAISIAEYDVGTVSTGLTGRAIELPNGAYTVTVTYQDLSQTKTVAVNSGETSRVDFTFQTQVTPPPPTTQSFSMLQLTGVCFVGVGAILEVKNRRRWR